jgi:mannose-6-phosphate isomerase-like protein (cupin superfamily)
MGQKVKVWDRNAGRLVNLGPIRMWVTEDGAETRGTFGIAEFEIAPNSPTPPPHVHHAHEEGFYVLKGELEFTLGTNKIQATEGTFVMVPIGESHTFSNPTEAPARFLLTLTPPRYLHYFEELSQILSAKERPEHAELAALMARYDTELL